MRCKWCDTAYGFEGGEKKSFERILSEIKSYGIELVELTGGEPLAQPLTAEFSKRLVDEGYKVLIETGGGEDISALGEKVHIIMDIKCPDSGMSGKNRYENIEHLKATDEIKFVIASRQDYLWARDLCREKGLDKKCPILFSVAFGLLKEKDLASWMVEDKLPYRLNLQQHKYIWSPKAKGV